MATNEHPLADAAVEALGGTPEAVARRPTSPLGLVLPPGIGRRIRAFDRAGERLFDHLRGRPSADRLFFAASALGDFSLLWHAVAAARALRRQHERAWLRLALALGVESLVVNVGVKSLFRRARPPWEQDRPRRLRQPRSSSFPSGHATSGFMAATLLADGRRAHRPVWYALAAAVAASRVHVKIHHASDVVAGAVIGVALGRFVRARWPLSPSPRSEGRA
jgi:undecaprenyl-diphosphatase